MDNVPISPGGRMRVTVSAGPGPQPAAEVRSLLHGRLRIFSLIGLAATTVFLIKDLIRAWQAPGLVSPVDVGLQAVLVLINLVSAGVLWGCRQLALAVLRVVELIMLGATVAFFAWAQYTALAAGWPFHGPDESRQRDILLLATDGLLLRWFGLLVGYGTLIPNTWKRCALIVGLVALAPLAVMIAFSLRHGTVPHLSDVLLQMAILMAIGAAIAVYGSHRIEELRQEAFEARKLGQYQLKKLLGTGGMGEVHLAEHVLLRRPCAIKLIRPEHAGDPAMLARFEREVQATATLTHWNTIEIYDYGRTADGTFYYVMEYLPGLTLQELIQEYGPLPPGRAVHLLRQVCYALREAHAIGLIHRDIKPSNIMTCERGRVYDVAKLLDFGLVRIPHLEGGNISQELTVAGSPYYMSPEQAKGKELDGRSDIYSLGAVAYFLLTKQPPFVRESPIEVMMAHVRDPVIRPNALRPDVPADLQEVVLRCLQKDPARRFADAESLEQALGQCACAGQWTQQEAAAWWRRWATPDNTREHPPAR